MVKIIIPYRDREPMLKMWEDIPNKLIVELHEKGPWNREILLNIGFLESYEPFFVFNDVDLVPKFQYIPRLGITQLATSEIQKHNYLGGVTMFDRATFSSLGGFHNGFWGGRGGDNEMFFHIRRTMIFSKINVIPHQFIEQHHERPAQEFIPEMWVKAKKSRKVKNQLGLLKYKVLDRSEDRIKVRIINF